MAEISVTSADREDSGETAVREHNSREHRWAWMPHPMERTLTRLPGPQQGKATPSRLGDLCNTMLPIQEQLCEASTSRGIVAVMTSSDGVQRFTRMRRWQIRQVRVPDELN